MQKERGETKTPVKTSKQTKTYTYTSINKSNV